MLTATNPSTESTFELPADTQTSEIVTDPNTGEMFEVTRVDQENSLVELELVTIEEDWGQ